MQGARWTPFDTVQDYPNIALNAHAPQEDTEELIPWATALKREWERFLRGEAANMVRCMTSLRLHTDGIDSITKEFLYDHNTYVTSLESRKFRDEQFISKIWPISCTSTKRVLPDSTNEGHRLNYQRLSLDNMKRESLSALNTFNVHPFSRSILQTLLNSDTH